MLDTGFLQQLGVRLFTLSSSLQFAEDSTASQSPSFHRMDPCSGKGKDFSHQLVDSAFDLSAIWAILKGNQPESGSPLRRFKLASEFIKVAGQALEHENLVSRPSWF